jgi:hypothetical protein
MIGAAVVSSPARAQLRDDVAPVKMPPGPGSRSLRLLGRDDSRK